MADEFENQLRQALRPVDAPEGFAERLMQRLPPAQVPGRAPVLVALPRPAKSPRSFALPAALAASLIAAVMLGQQMGIERQQREDEAGRAATRELMQALRVTSQKLDLAYEAVNNPSQMGEEENRS